MQNMYNETLKSRGIVVGDLVYHLLYGKDWRGILMGTEMQEKGLATPCERALVYMMPGTRYDRFFKTNYLTRSRISDSLGYVSSKWIHKLEFNAKKRNRTR